MKKRKSQQMKWYVTGILIFIGLLIGIIFITYDKSAQFMKNQKVSHSPTPVSQSLSTLVTPTVISTAGSEWKKFIHPNGDFNFEYPPQWSIELSHRTYDSTVFEIILKAENNKGSFTFENGGRGLPNFDSKTEEKKQIGTYSLLWTTLYRDNKPFQAYANFTQDYFDEKLSGIYINLPSDNQEEFTHTVEEIIASLEKP